MVDKKATDSLLSYLGALVGSGFKISDDGTNIIVTLDARKFGTTRSVPEKWLNYSIKTRLL